MATPPDELKVSREALFFGPEGNQLYGMAHCPAESNGQAVIVCDPFADDVQRSYRLVYNFGERLAEAGWLALRFNYRGCGDSSGLHAETDLTTRLEDVSQAITLVKEKYGIEKVTLLGLRFGANLACMAAESNDSVAGLILWEPILDGEKYFYDSLRSNIASQTFIYRKVRQNREQLVAELSKGGTVNIDGYEVNRALFEAGCRSELESQAGKIGAPTLLVSILPGKRPLPKAAAETIERIVARRPETTQAIVNELPFWSGKKIYVPSSPDLYNRTLGWLKGEG